MKHVLKNERGMALALAIVALVVVGALIASALFSGTQEQRAGENVRRALTSFGVAEEGVYDIIRGWDNNRATYAGLYPYQANGPAGDSVVIGTTTSASKTGSYSGTLFKLNDQLYLVDVTAQDNMSLAGRIRGGGASQRLGLLVRIKPPMLGTPAALTSGGANVLGGSASIDGNDQTPTGWTGCCPTDSAGAGIRTQTNDTVRFTGHPSVLGSPPVRAVSIFRSSTSPVPAPPSAARKVRVSCWWTAAWTYKAGSSSSVWSSSRASSGRRVVGAATRPTAGAP